MDVDVEEEYRKLKAKRLGIKVQEVRLLILGLKWSLNCFQTVEDEKSGVEREPLAASGLAGALKVASQKGYIEKGAKKLVQIDQKHKERISAMTYSIEDKNQSTISTICRG